MTKVKRKIANKPVRLYEETRGRFKAIAARKGLTMAEYLDRLSLMEV